MLVVTCRGYCVSVVFLFLLRFPHRGGHKGESRPAKEISGKRDIYQVLANGGLAGFLGMMALFIPAYRDLFLFLLVCSLSAATADTVSSELGSAYGKRFFNILTFRKDTCGENGVVSLEGFVFGLAGSCILACIYAYFVPSAWNLFWLVVISGTVGNVADSILGASLERSGRIGNNAVNFLNTLSGSLSGWILILIR